MLVIHTENTAGSDPIIGHLYPGSFKGLNNGTWQEGIVSSLPVEIPKSWEEFLLQQEGWKEGPRGV